MSGARVWAITVNNWNSHYNDCYFSRDDGCGESRHVFFDGNCLAERLPANLRGSRSCFTILETGFGSGLNVYLTAALALNMNLSGNLRLYSVEKHPLTVQQLHSLLKEGTQSADPLANSILRLAASYTRPADGWNAAILHNSAAIHADAILHNSAARRTPAHFRIDLNLYAGDIREYLHELQIRRVVADAVFADGHDPRQNPDMWTKQVFRLIAARMKPGSTLATFSAAGSVKRALRATGFTVQRRRGYGRKRHALNAVFTLPE
ncbi:MAG: tRNA (5-methylaminomethyl-2-thiouridine)(34)-methyltransferase MnmD [Salinispira sp.]